MLVAFAATARQEPTSPATEAPPITADRAPPQMLVDHLLTAEQDCAEFAELALQGDPQSVEASSLSRLKAAVRSLARRKISGLWCSGG
jgi:hypothetical protein